MLVLVLVRGVGVGLGTLIGTTVQLIDFPIAELSFKGRLDRLVCWSRRDDHLLSSAASWSTLSAKRNAPRDLYTA